MDTVLEDIEDAACEFWIAWNYEIEQGRKPGDIWLDDEDEDCDCCNPQYSEDEDEDVCCVGCGERVCGFTEEPPHKDRKDEAVCDDCWVNNPGENFLQSIQSGAEYFWETWNYEVGMQVGRQAALDDDGRVIGMDEFDFGTEIGQGWFVEVGAQVPGYITRR
tara:strand:+ start:222 stop:707 length:486 start_codon:yes stop_codon:yes gene_type:complete